MTTETLEVPYLDITDANFSITSDQVHDAREKSWYARTNYGIAVLRYAEVRKILRHPKVRQGDVAWTRLNGITEGPLYDWWDSWILHKEGEAHQRLRKAANPLFTQKAVAPLGPKFRALAEDLVDRFVDRGEFEFVEDFADPYTTGALTRLLGLPDEEGPQLARHIDVVGLSFGLAIKDNVDRIEAALAALYEYADRLIELRRKNPTDDLVAGLVGAASTDGALSETELRDLLVLLIVGAFDTTKNQLSLAMKTFLDNADQWELLAQRPELAPKAVEEAMRVNPTTRWVTREALETFEFGGVTIEEGVTIHVFNESAGTDARTIGDDPKRFDITQDRPPHFGFGAGVHHCLGHFIARSDMAQAFAALSGRLRDIRELPGAVMMPDSGNTGFRKLPVAFTKDENYTYQPDSGENV